MTRKHYRLSCNGQLYIVVDEAAVCLDCGAEFQVQQEETNPHVYSEGDQECVRKQRIRRAVDKSEQLQKARSR